MTDAPEKPIKETKKRRRATHLGVWLVSGFLMLGVIAGGFVAFMSGQTTRAPDWVTARVETALNNQLNAARVDLTDIEITFREAAAPVISLVGVRVFNNQDRFLAWVPRAQVSIDRRSLLEGQFSPQAIAIDGLRMAVRRNARGQYDLALGNLEGVERIDGSPAQLLEDLDILLADAGLDVLDLIEAQNVALTLNDQVSDRVWSVTGGDLRLERTEQGASFRAGFDTDGHDGQDARVDFSASTNRESLAASLGASIENISAADLAAWGPSVSWLELLDAPISGSLRINFEDNGAIEGVNAALDIGSGSIGVTGTDRTVAIQDGQAYFTFDPETQRLEFSSIGVQMSDLSFSATGHTFIRQSNTDAPRQFVSQLRFEDVTFKPEGLLSEPAVFSAGGADIRLQVDPFRFEIGQVSMLEGDTRVSMSGRANVDGEAFSVGLDASVSTIDHKKMVALWPVSAIPETRNWLDKNILAGEVFELNTALRIKNDGPPVLSVNFEFADAAIRFMPHMPPARDVNGYGSIQENRLTIVAQSGAVAAAKGGTLDAAGTIFVVPDLTARPTIGDISIQATGPLTAALSILDERPFEYLSKAGRPVDLGNGTASVAARVLVPLVLEPDPDDIDFTVQAEVFDFTSERLVEGRTVAAPILEVLATPIDGLSVGGKATLDGIPFEGEWRMPVKGDRAGTSRLAGAVTVTQRAADTLSLGIPQGAIEGSGVGRLEVDFAREGPPQLRFFSDLNQLQLALAPVGWSKSSSRQGALEVLATLSDPPVVDSVTFDAQGLTATGDISIRPDGTLNRAEFNRVQIGGWFEGRVDLVGNFPEEPLEIAVNGGQLDIRDMDVSEPRGGQDPVTLSLNLDRLIVSDGISLTGVEGQFRPDRGMEGTFAALVNGSTPVRGRLTPSSFGPALVLTSTNGGGVMRDAGIVGNGRGGDFAMTLTPRDREGNYDGRVTIRDIRVRDASALAEMLSALSIVGLLEQLDGKGLVFNEVDVDFVLTKDRVNVQSARAVGASLGLTMDGIYDLNSKAMDMQGVISPIYLINGVGQLVSRPGEGLFGFTYRLRGAVANPRVTVNPISILAPGFLRNIFRRQRTVDQ